MYNEGVSGTRFISHEGVNLPIQDQEVLHPTILV